MNITVTYRDQDIAREHGVYLIYLDPRMTLRGHAPKVAAACYRNGSPILCDNEVFVRSALERTRINIVAEFRSPPHKHGPDSPDIYAALPAEARSLNKHNFAVALAYGVWLLHLDPAGGPDDPKVAAIAYRGGKLIMRGAEAHVRAKLEHLGIEVVAECGGSEPHAHCVLVPML